MVRDNLFIQRHTVDDTVRESVICMYVDYSVVTGVLASRDTHQRHHVSVRSGQGHRGVLQGDCLILLMFVCALNFVFARWNDSDDTITQSHTAALISNTLVMQLNRDPERQLIDSRGWTNIVNSRI